MPLPGLSPRLIKAGLWSSGAMLSAATAVFLIQMLSLKTELQSPEFLLARSANASAPENTPANTVQDPVRPAVSEQPANRLAIEIGISPTEVLRRIGVPTSTRGDTWYYGNSAIVFANGCVVNWDNRPPYPLGKAVPPAVDPDQPVTCR